MNQKLKSITLTILTGILSFLLLNSCEKENNSITENLPNGFTQLGHFDLFNSGVVFEGGEVFLAGRPKDSRTLGVLKLDSDCNELWTKEYIETNYSEVEVIQQRNDGMVILGHLTNISSSLASLDKNGNEKWVRKFDSDIFQEGMTVIQTSDNGFLVVGSKTIESKFVILLIKYRENGDKLWEKTIEEEYLLGGFHSIEMENGEIIISAKKLVPPLTSFVLLKINSEGEKMWIRETGIQVSSFGSNLETILSTENELIVTINVPRNRNSTFDPSEMKIAKIDVEGATKWINTINVGAANSAHGIKVLKDKSLVVLGLIVHEDDKREPLLLKFDTDGNEIWRKSYNIERNFIGRDLIEIDEGFMIVGDTYPVDDIFNNTATILKVDKEGNPM